MKLYHFETCCVYSTAELINDMVDRAIDITWKTFCKHVGVDSVRDLFPDYSYTCGERKTTCGFHIKDDWAVSFHRSKYNGKKCYYLVHSGIEYIFTEVGVSKNEACNVFYSVKAST